MKLGFALWINSFYGYLVLYNGRMIHTAEPITFEDFQIYIFTCLRNSGYYLIDTEFHELRFREHKRLFKMSYMLWEEIRDFKKI